LGEIFELNAALISGPFTIFSPLGCLALPILFMANPNQKLVRGLGILVLLLMALVPPWELSYNTEQNPTPVKSSIGYHPAWFQKAPEAEADDTRLNLKHRVNLTRLGIQLAVVLVLTNVVIYVLKNPKAP